MGDLIAPRDVANFLLVESRERGDILTNLKLQKLLYYAQAWYLALHNRELFAEDFQAWAHGPVLPSQYHRFKEYTWHPLDVEIDSPETTEQIADHLTEIVDVFGVESAVELELMTHSEAPWVEARGDLPLDAICTNIISKQTMHDFYRALGGQG